MFSADRTTLGIIPAQDHGPGVPLATKILPAEARVIDQDALGAVYALDETGKPALGDAVCKRWWPAETRIHGAMAAIFPVIATEGGATFQEVGTSDASKGAEGGGDGGQAAAGVGGGAKGGAQVGGAVQPGLREDDVSGQLFGVSPSRVLGGFGPGYSVNAQGQVEVSGYGWFGARSGFSRFGGGRSRNADGQTEIDRAGDVFGARSSFSRFYQPKNRSKRAKKPGAGDGKVAAWFGSKDGKSPRNTRPAGDVTGGDDFPNTIAVHPIGDDAYRPDPGFRQMVHALPDVWPALPLGTVFLATAATRHDRQDNLLHPTDPRMYAVNVAGDPAMSSWVCDLTPADTADCTGPDPTSDGRAAPLHSMMRVVKMPEEAGGNGIAWQLAVAGQDGRHGGGLCYGITVEPVVAAAQITGGRGAGAHVFDVLGDYGTPGVYVPGIEAVDSPASGVRTGEMRPAKPAVGLFAHEMGGPLSLGSSEDKHRHGTTKDGECINGGHISCDTPFFLDKDRDAPLAFNLGPWRRPSSFARRAETFIVYDPGSEHPWVGGKKPGLWRLFTTVPFVSEGGGSKPRPTTPTPSLPPPPERRRPPGDTTPSDPGAPPSRPKGDITPGSGPSRESQGDAGGWDWHQFFGGEDESVAREALLVRDNDHSRGYGADDFVVMTTLRSGFASLAYKPQHTGAGLIDYRGSPGVEDRAADAARPMVLRADVFAKQDGQGWGYTHRPDHVRTGTAPGGLFFSAPEVDLLDSGSSYAPEGVTKSKAYAAVYGPGVRTAYGLPDTATGGVKTAVEAYGDAGALVWAYVDGSGTSTEAVRITTAGLVAFGGSSANDPALRKRTTNVLEVRTATNSAQASLDALAYQVANTRVVSTRRTGWTVPSGTAARGTFDTATVTTEELAQRVKALIEDLHDNSGNGHGLLGA